MGAHAWAAQGHETVEPWLISSLLDVAPP